MKTHNTRSRQHRRYMRYLRGLFPQTPTGGTHTAYAISVSAKTLPPAATFRRHRRGNA